MERSATDRSRGRLQSKSYFETHHETGDITATLRSQKDVSTQMVHVTDTVLKDEIKFGLSLDHALLVLKKGNIYNIARLQQELALQKDIQIFFRNSQAC